ncbi:formyltetrahydrofolate deformylase [uncultured Helicobacter sp.]|uniref:formyltetrahydrofolate deformylase n=1 Tax=uncultured Helicobacter sp. TaxID=175537 RepID=UPI00258ABB1F|nr:formyltetrahydrofolate deformylase [uncultured Helicobacter sp.]
MTYTLLISTDDTKGLVYNISSILYQHDLNIEKNDEFVDKEHNSFFMRTEIVGTLDEAKLLSQIKQALPQGAKVKLITKRKKSLILLATKENHCIGDLLLRYENNELNADIKAVIANRENLKTLVERFGIPFYWVDSDNKPKAQYEREMIQIIDSFKPDFLALAKYMRILSPDFVRHYKDMIINIHHSFLPAFVGANPYKQAYDRGVKIIGATAHFVTQDLDGGPIIAQDITQINHTYSRQDMQKAGRNIEKNVFALALDLVLNDRVFLNGNKTIIF